jgi:hypothetical protein
MRMIHAHEHAHPRCAQVYLQQPAPHKVSLAAAVEAKACAESAAACKLERGVRHAASNLEMPCEILLRMRKALCSP